MGNAKTIKTAQKNASPTIKGWKYIRLKKCIDDIAGTWGEQDNTSGLPVLRSTNFRADGYFDYTDIAKRVIPEKDKKAKRIKFGDILLERSGGGPDQPVGRVGWCDKTAAGMYFSNFCQLLRPHEDLNNKFLFYLLHYFYISKETFKHQQQTTGIRNLDFSSYTTIKLFLPENPKEQEKIAEILSSVDDVVDKTQKTIDQTQTLKKGLMQELFTRGLPGKHKKFKKTRLGLIPLDWEFKKLGNFCEILGGGTPSTKVHTHWRGTIPWISSADIDNTNTIKCARYISRNALKQSATNLIPKGSIIVATRVGLGKVAINDFDLCTSQDCQGITPDKKICDVQYLAYFVAIAAQEFINNNQGTAIKGVLKADLKETLVPLPAISEQMAIAKILSTLDLRMCSEVKSIENMSKLRMGLMQILLTGKVRVAL